MATIEEYAKQPKDDRMKRLERTADELAAAIKGHGGPELAKRPDEKNWAAVEVVCHLRDVEEAFGGRFQTFLAVDDMKMLPSDVDRWFAKVRNDDISSARFRVWALCVE